MDRNVHFPINKLIENDFVYFMRKFKWRGRDENC